MRSGVTHLRQVGRSSILEETLSVANLHLSPGTMSDCFIGRLRKLNLYGLTIDGVSKQKLAFVQTCKMRLHVLSNKAISRIRQFRGIASSNDFGGAVSNNLSMYLAHKLLG